MKSVIRTLIILVIVGALAYFGYSIYFNQDGGSTGGLVTTAGQGVDGERTEGPGRDFLDLLLSVRSLSLDESIFSSTAFTALQDFSRPIPPDTNPGRQNPFAPLGADSAAVSTQVGTSNPSSITSTTSTLNGTLTVGGPDVLRWFEYGTTQGLGTTTEEVQQSLPGAFSATIEDLSPNTTYYVKAVASIGGQTVAGNLVTWKTAE